MRSALLNIYESGNSYVFLSFFIAGIQGRLGTSNQSFVVKKLQSINRVISAYKGDIPFLPLQESEQFSS